MPTLNEAKAKVRELSQKGLDLTRDETLTASEMRKQYEAIEVDIKKWEQEVQDLEYVEEKRKSFTGGAPVGDAATDTTDRQVGAKSIGQQFVESAGYKSLMQRGLKGGAWTTGDIEIKTLLTEAAGGAANVATPSVLPGVVDIRFQPLTIASLFAQGTTTTPLIRYLVETTATNAAAATAEGGTKPESALAFTNVDESVRKIATFLPVTDEMLEDWAQAQSYIDNRLSLFVQIAEEAELLSGSGTAPHLTGILNRSGLRTSIVKGTAPSAAGDNDMDVLLRQITAIRVNSFLEPDAIVLNPTDWQTILLAKATGTGNYFAGGPFVDSANQTLWGKTVVTTTAITAGTALIGAFKQGGQVFRRDGLTVEASNSHSTFFQENKVAIRAEERLALAVYRPGAFGTVSNL